MTIDLSQLHPQKDFSSPKARNTPRLGPYWIALGALALVGSGYAAFAAHLTPNATMTKESWGSLLPGSANAPTNTAAGKLEASNLATHEASSEAPGGEPAPAANALEAAPAVAAEPSDLQTSEAIGSEDSTPTPASESDPGAAAAAAVAGPGAYYLQVASYHQQEDADAHAKTLSDRGLNAQAVAYGGPEAGWWHAVRMGPFKERVEAERRRFELAVHERKNAYVLPRSNGKFHVQIASFAEREQAEQVQKRFVAEGHATKVTRVKMSGSYWHCVRIGPFDTREEATAYKGLVADVPGSQSTVIPFGPPADSSQ